MSERYTLGEDGQATPEASQARESFTPVIYLDAVDELKRRCKAVHTAEEKYNSWKRYTTTAGIVYVAFAAANLANIITRAPHTPDIAPFLATGIVTGVTAGIRGFTAMAHCNEARDNAREQVIPVEDYLRAQLILATSQESPQAVEEPRGPIQI